MMKKQLGERIRPRLFHRHWSNTPVKNGQSQPFQRADRAPEHCQLNVGAFVIPGVAISRRRRANHMPRARLRRRQAQRSQTLSSATLDRLIAISVCGGAALPFSDSLGSNLYANRSIEEKQ
jgi:hypothetical protein